MERQKIIASLTEKNMQARVQLTALREKISKFITERILPFHGSCVDQAGTLQGAVSQEATAFSKVPARALLYALSADGGDR